jgi:hypothetical protein
MAVSSVYPFPADPDGIIPEFFDHLRLSEVEVASQRQGDTKL